jgi:hypothetical protein
MVLHFDEDTCAGGISPKDNFGSRTAELEGVLKQVAQRGSEQFVIDVDRELSVNVRDGQRAAPHSRLEGRRHLDLADEVREG